MDLVELCKAIKEELDKAKIIDMKSRKTLADLPYKTTPIVSHGSSGGGDGSGGCARKRGCGTIHPGSVERVFNVLEQNPLKTSKPKKVAPKKMAKEEVLKFDKNGQWALEKSVFNAGTHPPKGYMPGQKQLKDEHAEYDPKYSFKENRELVRMHHQDHKIPVKDESHLDSLTRAAAKRGGHEIVNDLKSA